MSAESTEKTHTCDCPCLCFCKGVKCLPDLGCQTPCAAAMPAGGEHREVRSSPGDPS